MGDDFFFAPPPPEGVPGFGVPPQPASPPAGAPDPTIMPGAPVAGAMPGMPGYSWQVHQHVQAAVSAGAPPAVPLSSATTVAAVAAVGGLLMMVASWAPWVTIRVASFHQTAGGLHSGLDGRYLLGMGFAALLTAVAALVQQSNQQVRMICAGALVLVGAVGLGIVIHEWTHVSQAVNDFNKTINSYANAFKDTTAFPGSSGPAGSSPFGNLDLFSLHVSKGWGLLASGVACSITGLAGTYMFLVK